MKNIIVALIIIGLVVIQCFRPGKNLFEGQKQKLIDWAQTLRKQFMVSTTT